MSEVSEGHVEPRAAKPPSCQNLVRNPAACESAAVPGSYGEAFTLVGGRLKQHVCRQPEKTTPKKRRMQVVNA